MRIRPGAATSAQLPDSVAVGTLYRHVTVSLVAALTPSHQGPAHRDAPGRYRPRRLRLAQLRSCEVGCGWAKDALTVSGWVEKEKLTITGLSIRSIRADRDEQVSAMNRRLIFVIAAGLALSGCCLGSGSYIQPQSRALTRWDGLGPLPVRNKVKPARVRKKSETVVSDDESSREAELAALKPYSEEWWSVRYAIDRAAEVKLSKTLIICRDCMPSTPDDQTGSITPR
jgi:hypothetical protein